MGANEGGGLFVSSNQPGQINSFHLDNGYEIIEARNPVTGEGIWSYQYPVFYRDRYGYSNGPRASPVIWEIKFMHTV